MILSHLVLWDATFHDSVESLVKVCDIVTINCPLHPETENLFDDKLINKMKKGAYIVNTARGKICNREAIAKALKSGQLSGYAGDVWFPQPAPNDHIWRSMPNHGMTPHTSGHTLSIREVRLSSGAEFVVVVCGSIMTMPGLPRVPAADNIKLNKKGEIEGLF